MKEKGWKIFTGIMIGVVLTASITVPIILVFTRTIDIDNQIVITSDRMFKQYRFPGSGTEGDPYIIENYSLNTEWYAIEIRDTTKFFIIRNCSIQTDWSSFLIKNVKSGTAMITNSTFYSENDVSGGIYDSPYCSVINNTFINIRFSIGHSPNSKIVNNTCLNGGFSGISITDSPRSELIGNICNDSIAGIYSHHSQELVIQKNRFYNCGLFLEGNEEVFFKYTVTNNTVNDKQLGFVTNNSVTDFKPSIYGQLYLINCSNLLISDLSFSHTSIGLSLISCNNITLMNIECKNNTYDGFNIGYSSSITLYNNTAKFNKYGLRSIVSLGLTLINNTFSFNDHSGASLDYSTDVKVINNTINSNYFGILIFETINSIINSNSFTLNSNYAVNIGFSSNNTIFHNNFFDNHHTSYSQGYDEGSNNYWYDILSSKGNYWSDWSSGNYTIDGYAGSMDIYPSDNPFII